MPRSAEDPSGATLLSSLSRRHAAPLLHAIRRYVAHAEPCRCSFSDANARRHDTMTTTFTERREMTCHFQLGRCYIDRR